MDEGLVATYTWVRRTREVLLWALDKLGPERYQAPQAILAGDGIRDRHIHIANCYRFWALRVGLQADAPAMPPTDFPDPASSRAAFAAADDAVARLLERFGGHLDDPIERTVWGQVERVTPRWLIMHPITHEFSNKGQIVVMVRLLGVEPFDADRVRPFAIPAPSAP